MAVEVVETVVVDSVVKPFAGDVIAVDSVDLEFVDCVIVVVGWVVVIVVSSKVSVVGVALEDSAVSDDSAIAFVSSLVDVALDVTMLFDGASHSDISTF